MRFFILLFTLLAYLSCNNDIQDKESIIVDSSINSQFLNREVKLWTYLPPNYDSKKSEKFPVIYMHDGQNLFYDSLSFVGEWKVDESLDSLFKEKGKQIVVVGIENGGEKRINELTPYTHEKYGGGNGDNYLQFLNQELIPFAEAQWNISTAPENRALWGSSLGGLISYYAAYETDLFSKFGVYSPSFWYSDSIYLLSKEKTVFNKSKMVITVGEKEDSAHIDVQRMESLIKDKPNIDLKVSIHADGEHSEWFWAREFYDDVDWLLNKQID